MAESPLEFIPLEKSNKNYDNMILDMNKQISILEKKIDAMKKMADTRTEEIWKNQESEIKKLKEENSRLQVELTKAKKKILIYRNESLKDKY